MQDAVYICWREVHVGGVGVGEVVASAGFDGGHVSVHDHVLCAGELFDECAAAGVIDVGVADEKDLDVTEVKAEFFDAVLDLRDGALEVAVDEDVALRGGDEVGGEVAAADVVEVSGDTEWLLRRVPVGVVLREESAGKKNGESQGEGAKKHDQA